jgi:hypothetical protein
MDALIEHRNRLPDDMRSDSRPQETPHGIKIIFREAGHAVEP